MRYDSPLASIFRTVLATVPALSLVACACPETRIVVPIRTDQIPPDAGASPGSRDLQPDECTTLCGGRARDCRIVEICSGVTASECVALPYTPDDAAGVDAAANDAGVATTRSFGVECTVTNLCIGGRRPEGFALETTSRETTGAYLARQAALESASVPAFASLADALHRLGAPRSLIERARAAMDDEVVHASMLGALARREGAEVPAFAARVQPAVALDSLAIENAIEGCVRETFAALVALHQSEHAKDPAVRAAFVTIAADEMRHAELSRDVHAWAIASVDDGARGRVERAMRGAIDELHRECCRSAEALPRDLLGLPAPAEMRGLIEGLDRALWSSAPANC